MSWYSDQPFHVYVITAGRFLKVGSTSMIETRIRHLQCAHYEELALAFSLEVASMKIAKAVETHAHALLAKSHIRGDWFASDQATARAAVIEASAAVERGDSAKFEVRAVVGPLRKPVVQRLKAQQERVDAAKAPIPPKPSTGAAGVQFGPSPFTPRPKTGKR